MKGRKELMKPRWIVKVMAHYRGYFWLPCPICGENFAGYEWKCSNQTLYLGNGRGDGVCPKESCIMKAHTLSSKVRKEEVQGD